MIGLSPLPRGHRRRFQPTCVRPSTGSYPCLSLPWGRSPGFASALRDSTRPVQARFRCGSVSLNLAAQRDSLAHSTKGTPSQRKAAPTAWRRAVSGAVSLPSRGAFHLSLTVLVRYRSQESVQPWRVVPPASRGVPRAPRYSGTVPRPGWLRVRGSHPLRPAFPCRSAATSVSHLAAGSPPPWTALQPRAPLRGARFGLARFRSPLLPGSRLISPPPGTEMFQFPGLPPNALWIQALVAGHDPCWVPPFGHPRIEGRLRLPGAYRRLPRPSSASCAKASAARP